MSDYAVVWPRSPKTAQVVELAKRPASLEGATIAFLWDYLFRGDEIFPIIERELSARYPNVTFVPYQTFGTTHGEGEHEVIAAMADKLGELGVDAVVSGMGC
jgi:UDP:flavonoid glycosyltransferase YjiC (YdhE family)